MMNKTEAQKLALSKIGEYAPLFIALIDISSDIEFEFGWLFYYQTKKYIKTRNEEYLLGGNTPIIVDKYKEKAYNTTNALNQEDTIAFYCKYRDNEELLEEVFAS